MSDNSSTGSSAKGTVRAPKRTKQAPRGRPFPLKPIEQRHRDAALAIANGGAVRPALKAAGYSDNVANRGVAALRQATPVLRALEQGLADVALRPSHDKEQDGNIITNVLRQNIMLKRDRALGSLTTLARIHGMLQPEAQTLVQVNVAAPSQAAAQWEDSDTDCHSDTKS